MRGLEAISGPSGGGVLEGHSGVNLRSILGQSEVISRKPHHISRKGLHLAVGRPLALELVKYGSWDGLVGGYPV